MDPISMDRLRKKAQTKSIIKIDLIGIFISLSPYAILAAKASKDKANTNRIDSNTLPPLLDFWASNMLFIFLFMVTKKQTGHKKGNSLAVPY